MMGLEDIRYKPNYPLWLLSLQCWGGCTWSSTTESFLCKITETYRTSLALHLTFKRESSQRKYPRDILLSVLTVIWVDILNKDTCQSSNCFLFELNLKLIANTRIHRRTHSEFGGLGGEVQHQTLRLVFLKKPSREVIRKPHNKGNVW
jgi:hypothetical protein